jgi:shikimate dehydrogenase
MVGQPPLTVDVSALPGRAVVADAVYVPLRTPLIEAARARGLRVAEGLGMLLHQAAPAFARWFGARPVVTPALRALVEAEVVASYEAER